MHYILGESSFRVLVSAMFGGTMPNGVVKAESDQMSKWEEDKRDPRPDGPFDIATRLVDVLIPFYNPYKQVMKSGSVFDTPPMSRDETAKMILRHIRLFFQSFMDKDDDEDENLEEFKFSKIKVSRRGIMRCMDVCTMPDATVRRDARDLMAWAKTIMPDVEVVHGTSVCESSDRCREQHRRQRGRPYRGGANQDNAGGGRHGGRPEGREAASRAG